MSTHNKKHPGEGGSLLHMGTTFFVEGVKNFFSFVHGSKMAIGEVMFLQMCQAIKTSQMNKTLQMLLHIKGGETGAQQDAAPLTVSGRRI